MARDSDGGSLGSGKIAYSDGAGRDDGGQHGLMLLQGLGTSPHVRHHRQEVFSSPRLCCSGWPRSTRHGFRLHHPARPEPGQWITARGLPTDIEK